VTLSASSVASGVTIEVSDDGAGVDPDLREALFAPGMSGSGGTGLGLGIARRVARSLGGEIELKDSGEGATFALVLPRG
jgi:signal transduction histidine kinase